MLDLEGREKKIYEAKGVALSTFIQSFLFILIVSIHPFRNDFTTLDTPGLPTRYKLYSTDPKI